MLNDTEIRSEAAKKKAELVRGNHTKCDCCSREINNSKYLDFDEHNKCDAYLYPNGYLYSYYLWDDKFLCQKCFNRSVTMEFIMKHPVVAAILVLIYIPLSLFDSVKEIAHYLSWHAKLMCIRVRSKCVLCVLSVKYRYRRVRNFFNRLSIDIKKKLLDVESKILKKEFDLCCIQFSDYLELSKKNCKCGYKLKKIGMDLFNWDYRKRSIRHEERCQQSHERTIRLIREGRFF